jgi:osmotically-inducible protein OsmY
MGVDLAIGRAGMRRARTTEEQAARELIAIQSDALIVIPPIKGVSTTRLCASIIMEAPDLPIFVVFEGLLSDGKLSRLYRAGVSAVFSWPPERQAFLQTLLRLSDLHDSVQDVKRLATDIALEEVVKQTLRAEVPTLGETLDLTVVQSVVVLRGAVDALWKLRETERIVLDVAGVQDVVSRAVVIEPEQTRPDAELLPAVRNVLSDSGAVDHSTIAVGVEESRVTLTGTAVSRREVNRLLDLIAHIRGVRTVENLVVISDARKQKDKKLRQKLAEALLVRFSSTSIEITTFGGTVVLTGSVGRASERAEIEDFALCQPGVQRVVNKIRVKRGVRRQ